jgi:hypothetical protein
MVNSQKFPALRCLHCYSLATAAISFLRCCHFGKDDAIFAKHDAGPMVLAIEFGEFGERSG